MRKFISVYNEGSGNSGLVRLKDWIDSDAEVLDYWDSSGEATTERRENLEFVQLVEM